MKNLIMSIPIADAGNTFYIPVPCKGIVKSAKYTCDVTMVATGTVILSRSTTAVNTFTVPAGDLAAGVVGTGTPDTTNKNLIFDPDSSTAANKVIKGVADATFLGSAGNIIIDIEYDDSCYVPQAASEA